MAEVIEFVDSVSASATVRLSLVSNGWSVLADGTDVSPPPLDRAIATTLLADGDIIPASAYRNRTIRLHLEYRSTNAATAATQVQLLNRELDREMNILRWQPLSTIPAVYFMTYRSPDYVPETDYGIGTYRMAISLVAQPFALGLPVTVTPVTVSNDPAAGSNGKFFDINSPAGDVETPLLIKIPGSSVSGKQSLFATRRRGTPSAMPFVLQTESMTLGTDTAVVANNAAYSGAGSNSAQTTFATVTSGATRYSAAAFPSSPSVDVRGTYRVFLRCAGSVTGSSFGVILQHGARNTNNSEAIQTQLTAGTYHTMLDLGLVQMPEGFDPRTDGPTGVEMAVNGVDLSLTIRRISASGNFITDYLLFVPADEQFGIVTWGGSTPTTFVFNGYNSSVYGLDASGRVADIAAASYVGDAPMIAPGQNNRIVYINDVSPQNSVTDTVSNTVTISPFYWPQYLAVRPTST